MINWYNFGSHFIPFTKSFPDPEKLPHCDPYRDEKYLKISSASGFNTFIRKVSHFVAFYERFKTDTL